MADDEDSRWNWTKIRNLVAFWIFGLCNNYAYVIMLSAAYDILREETHPPPQDPTMPWTNLTNSSRPQNKYDCNPISTASVLLADILPGIFIKYTSPWFAELIPFDVRIAFCIITAAASLIMVALVHSVPLSLIGVTFASISSGLGEFSFLSLAAFYEEHTVTAWSSGTGAAGLIGALSYAGITAAGLSPRNTILVMLVVPVLLAVSYWLVLVRFPTIHLCNWGRKSTAEFATLVESDNEPAAVASVLTPREKVIVIKSLLHFIISLTLVYIAEYFINQGLFELIFFPGAWLSHEAQYRWYQVIYQLGVFISRTSVVLIVIRHTWLFAILQWINVVIFLTQVSYFYIPSIYIIFVLVLYEGLLGGAAYVNTFYIIKTEYDADHKEFAMGVTSLSDATGIALSAVISIPVHNAYCSMGSS